MKPITLLLAVIFALVSPLHAEKKLRVVTTTSDLADIARRIAGDRAEVEALARGFQNPHFVDAKPSLIVRLIKADVFIQTGLDLETGWAPLLLRGSRNRNVLPGGRGYIDASEAIEPLEIPTDPSRAEGDVHPHGNPHYMADPANAAPVARLIAERLKALDPEGAPVYESNLKAFETELASRLKAWSAAMAPFKGALYVSYHRDWTYFADRFGLVVAGEIEPKPGIPPTAAHTAHLIRTMKERGVKIIITDPWYEPRTAAFIADRTGAKVLDLALFPGGVKGADDYFSTVDHNVTAVSDALGKP